MSIRENNLRSVIGENTELLAQNYGQARPS